jgi:anti-anti-sigma factor
MKQLINLTLGHFFRWRNRQDSQVKLFDIDYVIRLVPMGLFVKIVQYPDVWDNHTATQFHQAIDGLIESGVNIILLDFKNVTFISSSGLMAIVSAFRMTKAAGSKLFICSINEQVRMLFELTGMDRVFETFASLDEFNNTLFVNK